MAALAVLGTSACSADSSAGPTGATTSARVPLQDRPGFAREGDVILTVQQVVAQKLSSGVGTVLAPAVAAYRAAAAG